MLKSKSHSINLIISYQMNNNNKIQYEVIRNFPILLVCRAKLPKNVSKNFLLRRNQNILYKKKINEQKLKEIFPNQIWPK